jgi:hypothetical protein
VSAERTREPLRETALIDRFDREAQLEQRVAARGVVRVRRDVPTNRIRKRSKSVRRPRAPDSTSSNSRQDASRRIPAELARTLEPALDQLSRARGANSAVLHRARERVGLVRIGIERRVAAISRKHRVSAATRGARSPSPRAADGRTSRGRTGTRTGRRRA